MTATMRTNVEDTVLDVQGLIEEVHFGTFELKLPSSFAAPRNKDAPKKDPADNAKNPGGKKQGGKGGPGEKRINKRVNNSSPCHQFKLKQGEMWAYDFANMRVLDRVHWEGNCKMCPRWNIRGHCFDNCVNTDSHVEANKINPAKISEFKEFMQLIRDDNAAKRNSDGSGRNLAVSNPLPNHPNPENKTKSQTQPRVSQPPPSITKEQM